MTYAWSYEGTGFSGSVYEALSPNNKIENMVVTVYDASTGEPIKIMYTNPDGTYAFTQLPKGLYRLGVHKHDSYYISTYYFDSLLPYQASTLEAIDGKMTTGIDFPVHIGGTIKGYVQRNNDNLPIPYVQVNAYNEQNTLISYGMTLQDGSFQINLPEGTYSLEVFGQIRMTNIPVRKQVTLSNILLMVNIAGIEGTIKDSVTQEAIANMRINIYNLNGDRVGYGYTNPKGLYRIYVAPGYYKIQANNPDSYYVPEYYDNAFMFDQARTIPVGGDSIVSSININVSKGGKVSGIVLDYHPETDLFDPLSGVHVFIFDSHGSVVSVMTTPFDGIFSLCLFSGNYYAYVEPNNRETYYIPEYFNYVYDNQYFFRQASAISVLTNNESDNIQFDLDLGGKIFGMVLNEMTMQPLSGKIIYAIDKLILDQLTKRSDSIIMFEDIKSQKISINDYLHQARTRTDGSYAMNLPQGSYLVFFIKDGLYETKFYKDSANMNLAQYVSVYTNQTATGIDFNLNPLAFLYGDINQDGNIQINDAIYGLQILCAINTTLDKPINQIINMGNILSILKYTSQSH